MALPFDDGPTPLGYRVYVWTEITELIGLNSTLTMTVTFDDNTSKTYTIRGEET